jgi:hypothetical protein
MGYIGRWSPRSMGEGEGWGLVWANENGEQEVKSP